MKELFVKGLVLGPGNFRPVLLLKGNNEEDVLPVWLSSFEFDSSDLDNRSILKSSYFHQVTGKILKELGARIERCEFVDLVGHHQYVDLYLKGEGVRKKIRASAEESMSLCLAVGTKFFAEQDLMDRSRFINAELMVGSLDIPTHPYIM